LPQVVSGCMKMWPDDQRVGIKLVTVEFQI
jgi:hypothetical protein